MAAVSGTRSRLQALVQKTAIRMPSVTLFSFTGPAEGSRRMGRVQAERCGISSSVVTMAWAKVGPLMAWAACIAS